MVKKTPAGKGIRFHDGKTVFLRMATYKLVKRISKATGMPYNRVIHEAVKAYNAMGIQELKPDGPD